MTTLRSLHRNLSSRRLPEDVADDIIGLPGFSEADRVHFPARPSWYRWYGSSMSKDWDRPSVPRRTADTLATLLDAAKVDSQNPVEVRALIAVGRERIAIEGGSNFKTDRLNRGARKAAGLGSMSRRRYDKLFRIIGRLEKEVGELDAQADLSDLAVFAKTGFATKVPFRHFAATPATAAFVAYYTANLARRSLFTVGKQARALDTASEWLLDRCERDKATDWFAIAFVFPRADILARLTPEQRGTLLNMAFETLGHCADLLRATVTETMNIDAMIVRRGDDSSTWNAIAGSWNKARDLWLAAAWSLDPSIADAFCPGKVLRLMAADVVAWHRSSGGGLDPDTAVWSALPRPWAVFAGDATCTRDDIERVCREKGVDPSKSGWAKPRPRTAVDEARATPESVHGVVVAHPQLATLLRHAGWFSGKEVKPVGVAVTVERDEHGAAVNVY